MITIKAHSRRLRGITLAEVVITAGMTFTTLAVAVSVFLTGMYSWYRGQGKIDAERTAELAVRIMSHELRQAMSVVVDQNGMGLTYRLAQMDGNGSMIVPITWDNVTRRIQLTGSTISISQGDSSRVLCRDVITTDPLSPGGGTPYQIFSPGVGSITRSLTVMVVTQKRTVKAALVTGRSRETLYLRNIPELTQ